LADLVKDRFSGSSESILVTNSRHHEALRLAADSLDAAQSALSSGVPSDLVAQDLRAALYHLGTITGTVSSDEILGVIFSRFCIGK
jgi:tRNA modification GTPase